jgi:GLPGLI family protein
MKFICLFELFVFFLLDSVNSQTGKFISAGKIEFERKINLYSMYSGEPQMLEALKKNSFQFKTELFTLDFNEEKTFYSPGEQSPENNKFQKIPADNNIVFSQLDKNLKVSKKQIFDKTLVVLDTIKQVQWKLTNEKRQIIGFDCRRANGIILDSIYIVAFFTEEILTKGGPESFNGLPGMILGVAIPQQHITWFAKKLSVNHIYAELQKPIAEKSMSKIEYKDLLIKEFKPYHELGLWYYKFALF